MKCKDCWGISNKKFFKNEQKILASVAGNVEE